MHSAAPASSPAAPACLLLLMTAGGVHYAVRAASIRRLVPFVRLHAPPRHAPREFVGWLNFQGEVVPVVDGTLRLAGRPTEPTLISRILLIQSDFAQANSPASGDASAPTGTHTLGIIAESAHRTVRLATSQFQRHKVAERIAVPEGGLPLLPVMEHDGYLLHLLELEQLLTPELCAAFSSGAAQPSGAPLPQSPRPALTHRTEP
ncbi:hypothetical protein DB346_19850 [Verrucomicrobia bacterium LW23]|nr:hypothetical protein DB346_19850 [Verrucomicrobia bacterium LW23]